MSARPVSPRPTHRLAAGLAVALLLPLVACGDDDDGSATSDTSSTEAPSSEAESETSGSETTETTAAEPGADEVAITGVDYAFEGVPESIAAGTELAFTNESTGEVHEIVADPAGIGALLGGGPPAAVIVASPGGSVPGAVVGDGTLTEPGRYALICTIPTGVDPQEYLDAAAAAQGGPPAVEGGPPHFVEGMVAELTVEG
ncbi:MAG TPA: hypothetical protein VK507_19710 [Iamia sp.]|nr:hypothetical protein [Iamia sp.]